MSSASGSWDAHTLTPEQGRLLNCICRRFETAWLQGPARPRIEDFLSEWPGENGELLLRELIAVEWELRRRQGEAPTQVEYQRRFPGHADLIASLLRQTEPTSSPHDARLPPTSFALPDVLGPYRLVREVGRGGMGIVFEAVHEGLNRRVALKILRTNPLWGEQQIERFRREARTIASLSHPHVVAVHDVGEQDGIHFLAMQFVQGSSLAQHLAQLRDQPGHTSERTQPLPGSSLPPARVGLPDPRSAEYPRAIAALILPVAKALQHAHENGVLHRDVKPSNLLLDREGVVWLTDFGLARSQHDDLSLTGSDQVLGTPRYLAPEALQGNWQPGSDVYSLGLTLYELLTLRPAFNAGNYLLLIDQVLKASPPPPRQINPLIPPALETIVLRAISRSLDSRYSSAAALARDLQNYLERQPSPRWPRRARFLTAGAVGLACVGLLALALSWLPGREAGGDLARARPAASWVLPGSPLPGLLPCPVPLPDGRRWQLETVCARHHLSVFGWTPDGKAAVCVESNRIRIVQVEGGALRLKRLLLGHEAVVLAVAVSGTGRLASAGHEKTIRIWEPDGRGVAVLRGHSDHVRSLAWSPDGRSLVSSGRDGTVRVWDVSTGLARVLFQDPTTNISPVGWSADGRYVAAAIGQKAHVWSVGSWQEKVHDHGHILWALAWSPQGHVLATSGRDRRVRLWQPESQDPVAVLDVPAVQLAWHPDGEQLLAVPDQCTNEAHLWGRDGRHHGKLVETALVPISRLSWSPDGTSLGIGCVGGDLVVWRADGVRVLPRLLPVWQDFSVAWGPDGRLLAGSPLVIWSGDGTTTTRIPGGEQAGWVSWSPGGEWICARDAKTSAVWLMSPSGSLLQRFPSASKGALSPEGRVAVLSRDLKEFQVYNHDGTPGPRVPSGPRRNWVSGLAWDTTGRRLAVTALGMVFSWEVDGSGGLQRIAEEGIEGMGSPAWSPDGQWLAATSRIRILLHRADGAPHLSWVAHQEPMLCQAWSLDGAWLASVGQDRTLRLWKPTGQPGPSRSRQAWEATGLSWSADHRLALAGGEGTVDVLTVREGKLQPLWTGLLVGEKAVAFDAGGRTLQGQERTLDEHLVAVVEEPDGALNLLPPSQLHALSPTLGEGPR